MKEAFCWLDIETTGLDPNKCEILEIAAIVTAPNLVTLGARSSLVKADLSNLDDFITNMHTTSGLLEALNHFPCEPVGYHDMEFDNWIQFVKDKHQIELMYLAGSSIHFDRSFLKVHMPTFEQQFHYRMFDVSSLKMFSRLIMEDGFTDPGEVEPKHRALNDVYSSLNWTIEYAAFKEHN